jgi:hypothetical protein
LPSGVSRAVAIDRAVQHQRLAGFAPARMCLRVVPTLRVAAIYTRMTPAKIRVEIWVAHPHQAVLACAPPFCREFFAKTLHHAA